MVNKKEEKKLHQRAPKQLQNTLQMICYKTSMKIIK